MSVASTIAATAMHAQDIQLRVIADNLARQEMTAAKEKRAEFTTMVSQDLRNVGSQTSESGTILPSGAQVTLGVKLQAIYRNEQQGPIQHTANTLDVAIQGKGYFQVEHPSGETVYTRAGSFQLSADGVIVTAEGYTVLPSITIEPGADIIINTKGEVSIVRNGQGVPQVVGQLELASFANPAGLSETLGEGLLLETPASGAPSLAAPGSVGYGTVLQSALEGSNIDPITSVTKMITTQRAYEMDSKVLTTDEEMGSILARIKS